MARTTNGNPTNGFSVTVTVLRRTAIQDQAGELKSDTKLLTVTARVDSAVTGKSRSILRGDMLFLNAGEGGRADAYFAQRVLQYRDAVANMGRRASHLTHNMRIKTFKIMTSAARDLQRRSILEEERGPDIFLPRDFASRCHQSTGPVRLCPSSIHPSP